MLLAIRHCAGAVLRSLKRLERTDGTVMVLLMPDGGRQDSVGVRWRWPRTDGPHLMDWLKFGKPLTK